jgi:DNA-binding LacI/PurR family transcriptional regulator
MRALLDLSRPPTAVFCINDLVAAGALKICSSDGVSVPGEMSIVGCDDIELASLLVPELTTVSIPARELGARAARILLQALQGEEEHKTPPRPRKTIASRLVVRGTTAPPSSSQTQ